MPTPLLSHPLAEFLLQTFIHPQNPATNLMTPNPKLTQANRKVLRQQPSTASLKQELKYLLVNLVYAGNLLNHRLLKMKQTLETRKNRALHKLNLLDLAQGPLQQLLIILQSTYLFSLRTPL
jgi:hypothetical protein